MRLQRQRLTRVGSVVFLVEGLVLIGAFAAPYWSPTSSFGHLMQTPLGFVGVSVVVCLLCMVVGYILKRAGYPILHDA